jgi:hypothetical protein
MARCKLDNKVKNIRAAILQHSDVSLAAWTLVTNPIDVYCLLYVLYKAWTSK